VEHSQPNPALEEVLIWVSQTDTGHKAGGYVRCVWEFSGSYVYTGTVVEVRKASGKQ
jgi:hypothetical protein